MAEFRYTAEDPLGRPLNGVLTAPSRDAALAQLSEMGLKVRNCSAIGEPAAGLGTESAALLNQQVQSVTDSGVPLSDGLRLLARETRSGRLRRVLNRVCDQLEQGHSPADVFTRVRVPGLQHIPVLFSSALPVWAVSQVLERSASFSQQLAQSRWRTLAVLSYPVILLFFVLGLLSFQVLYVIPMFKEMFEDFGTQLPALTLMLVTVSDVLRTWLWPVVAAGFLLAFLSLLVFQAVTPVLSRRLLCQIPIVGSMYRNLSLSELAFQLGLYLDHRIPLPEALEWAGSGGHDPDLEVVCRKLAEEGRTGAPMAQAAALSPAVPMALQQLIYWAETHSARGDLLQSASDEFRQRTNGKLVRLLPLLEPVVMIVAVVCTGIVVVAMFLPLVKLLNDLS